jgi:hypothetical protein
MAILSGALTFFNNSFDLLFYGEVSGVVLPTHPVILLIGCAFGVAIFLGDG